MHRNVDARRIVAESNKDHGADADQDGFDGYSAKLDNPGEPDGSLTGNSRSGQKQGRLVGCLQLLCRNWHRCPVEAMHLACGHI